jgi:hypothetical protein
MRPNSVNTALTPDSLHGTNSTQGQPGSEQRWGR